MIILFVCGCELRMWGIFPVMSVTVAPGIDTVSAHLMRICLTTESPMTRVVGASARGASRLSHTATHPRAPGVIPHLVGRTGGTPAHRFPDELLALG